VIDQPLEVKLSKVDENGASLAGASMTLTDKNTGKLVHSWVSGTEPEKLVMTGNTGETLVAGHTYILHEETPPSGYAQAEDVEFYFNGDGTIPNCGYHLVQMVDKLSNPSDPGTSLTSGSTPVSDTDGPTPGPDGGSSTSGGSGSSGASGASDADAAAAAPSNVPAYNGALPTGDSPAMWIFLALALICLGGGIALFIVRRKKGKPTDPDKGDQ